VLHCDETNCTKLTPCCLSELFSFQLKVGGRPASRPGNSRPILVFEDRAKAKTKASGLRPRLKQYKATIFFRFSMTVFDVPGINQSVNQLIGCFFELNE